jgi:hypothetical protein
VSLAFTATSIVGPLVANAAMRVFGNDALIWRLAIAIASAALAVSKPGICGGSESADNPLRRTGPKRPPMNMGHGAEIVPKAATEPLKGRRTATGRQEKLAMEATDDKSHVRMCPRSGRTRHSRDRVARIMARPLRAQKQSQFRSSMDARSLNKRFHYVVRHSIDLRPNDRGQPVTLQSNRGQQITST